MLKGDDDLWRADHVIDVDISEHFMNGKMEICWSYVEATRWMLKFFKIIIMIMFNGKVGPKGPR